MKLNQEECTAFERLNLIRIIHRHPNPHFHPDFHIKCFNSLTKEMTEIKKLNILKMIDEYDNVNISSSSDSELPFQLGYFV